MSLLRRLPEMDAMWDIIVYVDSLVPQCRAVLMVVHEMNLDITIKEISLKKQEHLTEKFLKMNPLHTVPVLEENGYVLTDSHAMSCFLIDDFSSDINPLYPKQISVRAEVHQFLVFEAERMFPPVKSIVQPLILGQECSISEEKIAACREMFSYLDKFLVKKKWLVEYAAYTVADISCVTTASSISILMDMDLYPNVKAWMTRCAEQIPSYRQFNEPGLKKLHALIRSALSSSAPPSSAPPSSAPPSSAPPSSEPPSSVPPSSETPSSETPSSETPSSETPSSETPSSETPSSAPPTSPPPSSEPPSSLPPTSPPPSSLPPTSPPPSSAPLSSPPPSS